MPTIAPVLRQIAHLIRLLAATRSGRIGFAWFAVVLALELAQVALSVRMIAWTADFYNAVQKLDAEAALRQIGLFFGLTGTTAALYLAAQYLKLGLQWRWRAVLTEAALDRWLAAKSYWRLAQAGAGGGPDNPDQRIAEDCKLFVTRLTVETLDLISRLVGLASYLAILWSLSTFPLSFTALGVAIEIPRYLVWLAPLYVLISSVATHVLGRPIKAILAEQQHREADFRFALARVREHVDGIAFADGEVAERRGLDRRFGALAETWRRYMRRDLVLGMFTRPYMTTVLRVPLFLALPAFLAGHITFGGLMQVSQAFGNVVTTLSWFIFSYRDLADLGAAAARLDGFLAAVGREAEAPSAIAHLAAPSAEGVTTRALQLAAPDGRSLLRPDDVVLRPGEHVWLRGASGTGKTTFLKALSGLWRHGGGVIARDRANGLFLAQHTYLPLDGLAATATYPTPAEDIAPERIAAALALVGLDADQSTDALSGGERQRAALARLVIHRPRFAFLDEATSALDSAAEAQLLARLNAALPETTFVIAAHRRPEGLPGLRVLDITAARADAVGLAAE